MDELSRWLKALADPVRLRLIWLLADGREHCVCELTAALSLPQPTISRHLRTLREADLVSGRRQGTWTHYSLVEQTPHRAAVLDSLREALAATPQAFSLRAACTSAAGSCRR